MSELINHPLSLRKKIYEMNLKLEHCTQVNEKLWTQQKSTTALRKDRSRSMTQNTGKFYIIYR